MSITQDVNREVSLAILRREADTAAQLALRDMNAYVSRNGHRNNLLDARYTAAERLLDMIDAEIERMQVADAGAPDYHRIFGSEAEAADFFGGAR